MGLQRDSQSDTYDLLVAGARVVDGTGAAGRTTSVAVHGDTITAVGEISASHAGRVIDGSGLVLAPGFIDMHAHSDWTLAFDPTAESKVRQGVTTEVVGNCGQSPAPVVGKAAEHQHAKLARQGIDVSWRTMGDYLDTMMDRGVGINLVALVGHAYVRRAAMGDAMRAPDATELAAIRSYVAEAMSSGAFGMSFGGVYPPSSYAATDELVEAAKEVAVAGGIYACHMRNEAVEESIRIGRESGASVQISHLKAGSTKVWGQVKDALNLIEVANAEGVPVTVDQYPYLSGSSWLRQTIPAWAHEGGQDAIVARLRDPAERKRIRNEMRVTWPARTGAEYVPGEVLVAHCEGDRSLEGKTVLEIAAEWGVDPRDAVLEILSEKDCGTVAIYFGMCEDDVRYVMRHPLMMVGSDAVSMVIGGKMANGKPHPRTYGTFARILGHYVRDEGVLPLEEAGAKMTSRPAAKLGLEDRGTIEVGKKADLVLFSAERIRETATYHEPHRYAEGVELVIMNGRIVLDGAQHTGILAGRVLRKN
jgi:N-acyl-D-amino-acid deacylase